MSQPDPVVADEQVVSLDFVMRLDDGQVVGQTPDGEPLQYLQGQGEILPGLEAALYGMEIGEEKSIDVSPADGFGEYDPEHFAEVPRDSIPDDVDVVEGNDLLVQNTDNEDIYQAIIVEVGADSVKLDFNHPLAGNALHFDVKVVDIRPASAEELSHGHAHTPGHEH
jgi:FKBP-type peptidyl-prolyl cis-trans isomerase SlyD